jgi:N-acetyl-1-D-myo-inositol-2-amino-2-deoxy-alpha-D-glucopyranoside deacetylase
MKKTVLALFAHPDDEAFGPSGTLALLAKDYDVHLVCATRGEGGENHHPDRYSRDLAEIRSEELKNSARVLGIKEVIFLDFPDGYLSNEHYGKFLDKTQVIVDVVKPERLLTFEQNGLTGHMDHIFVSKIAASLYNRNQNINMLMYYCFDENSQKMMKEYYQKKDFNIFFPRGYNEKEVDLAVDVSPVWKNKKLSMNAHISQKLDRETFLSTINQTQKKELFLVEKRG